MESAFAIRLFDNFWHLYAIFVRVTKEQKYRDQLRVNQRRWVQNLEEGDMVFRKLPAGARPPKKMLNPASEGPFFIVKQRSKNSAVLRDEAGNLVSKGDNIPLTQLIVGPKRRPVQFDEADEVRSPGDMVANPQYFGKVANQKVGWEPLAPGAYVLYKTSLGSVPSKQLLLGKVLENLREEGHIDEQVVFILLQLGP